MEPVAQTYLERVRITPAQDGTVRFDATIARSQADVEFHAVQRPRRAVRALARQIDFLFSERVQRERGNVPREPGNTPAQLAPSHQSSPPQKPEESYLAGHSREERVVDVEQRSDGPLCPSFNGIIEHGSEVVVTLHSVGGSGEYAPPDSTGPSID